MYERVQELCKAHGISVRRLEQILKFSNGAIGHWKVSSPKLIHVEKVAHYFQVSLDYLALGIRTKDD